MNCHSDFFCFTGSLDTPTVQLLSDIFIVGSCWKFRSFNLYRMPSASVQLRYIAAYSASAAGPIMNGIVVDILWILHELLFARIVSDMSIRIYFCIEQ